MEKIIEKHWGQEEILEINDNYMLKRLTMNKGCKCSLQYHNKKCETIYVLSGELKLTLKNEDNSLFEKIYKQGEYSTIKPFKIHRMEAIKTSVYLEASTPYTDDTVRIEDEYNRI